MPRKSGSKTPNERLFVKHYVATGDHIYAAQKAGYAVPASGASQALMRPAIQEEISRERLVRLQSLVPKAFDHIENVLNDAKAPIRDKTMVAKIVLDLAKSSVEETAAREFHEMTAEELSRAREQILGELAARARPVLEHESAQPAPDIFA